jgi:hypothetical protein
MKMEAKPKVAIVARPRMLATAVVVSRAIVTMLIILVLPAVADACDAFVSFGDIILHSILLNGGIRFPI